MTAKVLAMKTPPPMDVTLDRPLPQSPDSERAVLGAILESGPAYARVARILETVDFFKDSHRLIFDAMRQVDEDHVEIDLLTVKHELQRRGRLEQAGGSAYVSSLVDVVPDVANVERYAKFVREKSALRQLVVTGNSMMRAALEGDLSAGDIASTNALRLSELAVVQDSGPQPIGAVMRRVLPAIEERSESGDMWRNSIRIGLSHIDAYTLGLQRGALSIGAARTRVGKTVLSNSIALGAAARGERVLYLELDMPERMLGERLLSAAARVSSFKLRSGIGLSSDEWNRIVEASARLSKSERLILDCSTRSIAKIAASVRRCAREGGIDLIIVDHIGHVRGGRGEQRYLEIGDVSSRLIEIAGETNAAVLALVQLKREAEEREPILSDLRESGNLEQDARLVLLLDRPALRGEEKDGEAIPECEMRIRVAKNEGEAGAMFTAHFDQQMQILTAEPERRCGAKNCPFIPDVNEKSFYETEERTLFA